MGLYQYQGRPGLDGTGQGSTGLSSQPWSFLLLSQALRPALQHSLVGVGPRIGLRRRVLGGRVPSAPATARTLRPSSVLGAGLEGPLPSRLPVGLELRVGVGVGPGCATHRGTGTGWAEPVQGRPGSVGEKGRREVFTWYMRVPRRPL